MSIECLGVESPEVGVKASYTEDGAEKEPVVEGRHGGIWRLMNLSSKSCLGSMATELLTRNVSIVLAKTPARKNIWCVRVNGVCALCVSAISNAGAALV